MKKESLYFTGATLAGAAVLYFDGKLTATKHNYVPVVRTAFEP